MTTRHKGKCGHTCYTCSTCGFDICLTVHCMNSDHRCPGPQPKATTVVPAAPLHEIELWAKDRERGEAMAKELEAWQMIFGGTTTMVSNTILRWHPDDDAFSQVDPLTMILDTMVEFGVINTAIDTWSIVERR